jgi:parallel beta-helix repeat protein
VVNRVRGLAALVAVVLGAGVANPSVVRADPPPVVRCGTVITADTTLANDLANCRGIALIVAANHVKLDLDGHTVDGDGAADVEGIQVDGQHDVTIANGTITDFVEGVAILDSRQLHVHDLTLAGHRHVGVFIDRSSHVGVERTRLSRIAFSGIFATRSTRLRIEDNRVTDSGGGVGLRHTTRSRVAHNRSARTDCGAILLYDGSRKDVIDSNVVLHDGCEGVVLHARSGHNLIRRNQVRFSDAGVGIDKSSHNLVAGNVLHHNHFVGVYVVGASDNTIERNQLVRNGEGSEGGIHVLADAGVPSERNAITRNRVIASVGDGIWLETGSQGTSLVGNTVTGSTDDGIDVDEPQVTVARNLTVHNRAWGIDAVLGVIDGRGNKARGNGVALQCLHVECT